MKAPIRQAALTTLVMLLTVMGCGGGGRGDVSGKVTYHGKPLVWGTVQIEGSDHTLREGNINPDGTYSIKGVAPGEAKVAVNSVDPNSPDFQLPTREGREGRDAPKSRPAVKGWFAIPKEYQDLSKPKLSYPIKSGSNHIDIDLQ